MSDFYDLKHDLSHVSVKEILKELLFSSDNVKVSNFTMLSTKYLDVMYFTLKCLKSIVKDLNNEQLENPLFSINFFTFMMTFLPNKKKESKFYISNPPKPKSKMAHNLRISSLRHNLTEIWIELLNKPLSDNFILKVLDYLGPKDLLDRCSQASLLANYIFTIFDPSAFDYDSSHFSITWSILASRCVLKLVTRHCVNYDRLYQRLFELLSENLFDITDVKHEFFSIFMDDLDIYLSSLILPINTLAAFCVRLSQLALISPKIQQTTLLHLLYRCLKRQEAVRVLVNDSSQLTSSVYLDEEKLKKFTGNFDDLNALSSSLWEMEALMNHPSSDVRKIVNRMLEPLDIIKRFNKDSLDENLDLVEKPLSKLTQKSINHDHSEKQRMIQDLVHIYRSNYTMPEFPQMPGWVNFKSENL